MNGFDDELRRILGDERLSLNARADAVGRIVRGARRRRTTRMVASAAGSVGLVAAVAVGSVAVSGQFTATPQADPAGTPTTLETPALRTIEKETPPPTPPGTPANTEAEEEVEPPTGESPDVPPDEETEAPPAGGSGTEAGGETGAGTGTDDGSDPAIEDPAAGTSVVYPNQGIDGFTVGTKLTDLENIPGVVITPYEPGTGYHEACYGEYRSANAHGVISVRGAWGEYPEDLRPLFEVATMHFDTPVSTPEGIAVGSTESDLLAALPTAWAMTTGDYRAEFPDDNVIVRAWHFLMSDGAVAEIVMEGAAQCDKQPITDPPASGTQTG